MAVASQTVAASLFAAQDAEEMAFATRRCLTPPQPGCITLAAHQRFNTHLVNALTMGKAFNQAVRTWDHDRPMPEELAKLKAALLALTAELAASYPEDVRAQILVLVTSTYDAILAVFAAAGQ
jgi:uncharacterized membrane protein YbaN (DUF454 family)